MFGNLGKFIDARVNSFNIYVYDFRLMKESCYQIISNLYDNIHQTYNIDKEKQVKKLKVFL